MLIANQPLKWLIPWAAQSTGLFELPTTSADATRASQSLGFPPQTMLPPESGGVPPQGPDFNAGLWQVARITWWLMYGGPFVYDATFATNAAISGYAQGAEVSAADYLGRWRSTVDSNQVNPDTVGTNWVPSAAYGSTATALTNANVTLTPLQAMKPILVFTGTLTGNVVVTLPAWVYEWTVVNNTSGNFTLTLTTSGGAGAVVAQGGASQVRGDGTNTIADAPVQATGRLLRTTVYSTAGSFTFTPHPLANQSRIRGSAGGAGGGGTQATTSSTCAAGTGGSSGSYIEAVYPKFTGNQAVVVGAGGLVGVSSNGFSGGDSTFGGSTIILPGGKTASVGPPTVPPFVGIEATPTTGTIALGATTIVNISNGIPAKVAVAVTLGVILASNGAGNIYGQSYGSGGPGSGGNGSTAGPSSAATSGTPGSAGFWCIDEYS